MIVGGWKKINRVVFVDGNNMNEYEIRQEIIDMNVDQYNHRCHWPTCNEHVPPKYWGCGYHWKKLPVFLKRRVWATYRPGQEIDKNPSKEYLRVADQIQVWIRANHPEEFMGS